MSIGIQLRPYQLEGAQRIREAFRAGKRAPLYVAPTGSGKTALFSHIAHGAAAKGNRVLVLSHRIELVDQISDALTRANTEHGFIAADYPRALKQCMVASVPTLLRRLDKVPEPQLIIVDECIDGNAQISTELGIMRLSEVRLRGANYVLSYDGSRPCYRKIVRFWSHGKRPVVSVQLSNGTAIRCTPDHLFLTQSGWMKAECLQNQECVHVDADNLPFSVMGLPENGYTDTESINAKTQTSQSDSMPQEKTLHCAHAAVGTRSFRQGIQNNSGEAAVKKQLGIHAFFWGMTRGPRDGAWSFLKRRSRQFSVRCSEIVPSASQTADPLIAGWLGRMGRSKHGGCNTKLAFLGDYLFPSQLRRMPVSARSVFEAPRHACRALLKFAHLFTAEIRRLFPQGGWMKSALLGSRGGIATMDHLRAMGNTQYFTQKGTATPSKSSSRTGSPEMLVASASQLMEEGIRSCGCTGPQQKSCSDELPNSSPLDSPTKWVSVRSVNEDSDCDVFDIEVDETHCFFANGILVHNCHHAAAKTWKKILTHWPRAKILGVTATPVRTSGEGLGDLFDCLILGPSVAELTEMGYLAAARVFAPPTVDASGLHTRAGDFVTNEAEELIDKPAITGDALAHYRRHADGKPALAFCVCVAHAHHLAEQFRAAGYSALALDGTTAKEVRRGVVADFRRGAIKILASADLFSEGFDVPGVHVGIMLRPTQSLGLWRQQMGRILRPCEGKTHAILLDHTGNSVRHGLPDTPHEWTLDGEDRKPKSATTAVKVCPHCFCALPTYVKRCDQCGFEFIAAPRKIEEREGELHEITAEDIARRQARGEQGRAQTLEALLEIERRKGFRPGWAKHVYQARQAKRART